MRPAVPRRSAAPVRTCRRPAPRSAPAPSVPVPAAARRTRRRAAFPGRAASWRSACAAARRRRCCRSPRGRRRRQSGATGPSPSALPPRGDGAGRYPPALRWLLPAVRPVAFLVPPFTRMSRACSSAYARKRERLADNCLRSRPSTLASASGPGGGTGPKMLQPPCASPWPRAARYTVSAIRRRPRIWLRSRRPAPHRPGCAPSAPPPGMPASAG